MVSIAVAKNRKVIRMVMSTTAYTTLSYGGIYF